MRYAGKLGINEDDHVVLYDTVGVFSSPRGLFTFKGKHAACLTYDQQRKFTRIW